MEKTLKDQVAVITGGLGDIGHAIALHLAKLGADVAISDIRPAKDADSILEGIHALRQRATYQVVDVSDANRVAEWMDDIERELGLPTLIVPNAAMVMLGQTCAITPQQWSRMLQVNLNGAFFVALQGAKSLMRFRRPGRIIFIGSWAAHAPHIHAPAYCASKAALRMLCKVMVLDLASHGILVNEVAPGYVDAGLTGKIWADNPGSREQSQSAIPTRQLIAPEEVAMQVAYLCDPRNRHMTGATILMDGGLSLTNASMERRNEQTGETYFDATGG